MSTDKECDEGGGVGNAVWSPRMNVTRLGGAWIEWRRGRNAPDCSLIVERMLGDVSVGESVWSRWERSDGGVPEKETSGGVEGGLSSGVAGAEGPGDDCDSVGSTLLCFSKRLGRESDCKPGCVLSQSFSSCCSSGESE